METFLNSNLFTGLATIVTGTVAIIIYFRQKSDAKVQAARVLLMEIRTAEERIGQIKEKLQNGLTNDLPLVFSTKSWGIYSHMFISDFDQDELKLIGDFFDYGEIIEDFCKKDNNFFWINTEERAKVTQQKLAEIVIYSKQNEGANLEAMKKALLDGFVNDTYTYSPRKTIDAIKNYLEKMNNITTSSCGMKLKKIAKLK